MAAAGFAVANIENGSVGWPRTLTKAPFSVHSVAESLSIAIEHRVTSRTLASTLRSSLELSSPTRQSMYCHQNRSCLAFASVSSLSSRIKFCPIGKARAPTWSSSRFPVGEFLSHGEIPRPNDFLVQCTSPQMSIHRLSCEWIRQSSPAPGSLTKQTDWLKTGNLTNKPLVSMAAE